MFWEALGSVVIGLAIAYASTRRLPERLPAPPLVLATGAVAALFGGLVTHTAVGDGHPLATLVGAVVMCVALLSLLIRPSGRVRRSAAA
ncbi:hypothetical protein ABT112_29545 [Streptomyces sp. NPDC002055]|uniref:hypothetical protein n=1 Tax=Streptomyces sp. NPDC002055 TaxID=3154534 RepID=UPI0033250BA6